MTDDPLFPEPRQEWEGKRYRRKYDEGEVRAYASLRPPPAGGRPTGQDAARRAEARKRRGWD